MRHINIKSKLLTQFIHFMFVFLLQFKSTPKTIRKYAASCLFFLYISNTYIHLSFIYCFGFPTGVYSLHSSFMRRCIQSTYSSFFISNWTYMGISKWALTTYNQILRKHEKHKSQNKQKNVQIICISFGLVRYMICLHNENQFKIYLLNFNSNTLIIL